MTSAPTTPRTLGAASHQLRILLVDDEEVIHRSVGGFLEKAGHQVSSARSGEQGLEAFDPDEVDLVISDIKMPGLSGIELLEEVRARSLETEVILITGHGDVAVAVEAMKKGAFDFFKKPVRLEDLLACLERTLRFRELRDEKRRIEDRLELIRRSPGRTKQPVEMVAESTVMKKVVELVKKVAATPRTTVLISGESGSGKELVARLVHHNSDRRDGPFISVNCSALTDTLIDSELFGHRRGAFTDAKESRRGLFEMGSGGTLLLDEIGDMNLGAQAKVLRALEERKIRRVGGSLEREIDVRLVAATHRNLEELIARGEFRQDLYHRLKVFTIDVPPLRRRGEDVVLLAYYYLGQCSSELRKEVVNIDPMLLDQFRSYAWPGNVRELRNLIERAVILCDSSSLSPGEFAALPASSPDDTDPLSGSSLDLGELEKAAISSALERADGNQTEAARLLGLGHDALRYRMKKHDLR